MMLGHPQSVPPGCQNIHRPLPTASCSDPEVSQFGRGPVHGVQLDLGYHAMHRYFKTQSNARDYRTNDVWPDRWVIMPVLIKSSRICVPESRCRNIKACLEIERFQVIVVLQLHLRVS